MAVCTPVLVGPVSELSKSIRVQGALPFSEIVVSSVGANPRAVANRFAAGGDDLVDLIPGEKLRADDLLVVTQETGTELSAQTPKGLALGVQPAPSAAQVGAVGFLTHLYSCGQHVWVVGAIPGATVEVDFSGTVQASGAAEAHGARFTLPTGLPANSNVGARQVTPAGAGPKLRVVPDPPPLSDDRLPPPVIVEPIMECQRAVNVIGVVDGATVTLRHAAGATDVSGFDLSGQWFGLDPLQLGDSLVPRQDLPGCKITGRNGRRVRVERATPKAPVVESPCAGSVRVDVSGLVPGATVRLKVGSKSFVGMPPPTQTHFGFMVDPLPSSGTVEVTQELCNVVSPKGTAAIKRHEDVTRPVTVDEPLLACGRAIHVTHSHPGAILQAFARASGGVDHPISGFIVAPAAHAKLGVTPFLRDGDQITVKQWACTTTPTVSAPVVVRPRATPQPPKIHERVFPDTSVAVENVLPGAFVEVESVLAETSLFIGAAVAHSTLVLVSLTRRLQVGDRVRARQTMCDVRTRLGPESQVVRPPPQEPVLDAPANGANSVDRRPTLKWHDPGASTEGRADSFEIFIKQGNAVKFHEAGLTTPSFRPPSDLAPATAYMWMVSARNVSGNTSFVARTFSTGGTAPPPAPHLDSYNVSTKTLTGGGFTKNHSVTVRLAMFNSSVMNPYGVAVPDTRDVRLPATSDAQGNLSVVIDPKTALPILPLADIYPFYYLEGVAPGEVMHFSATDGRPNPPDLTGFLQSNTLHVTAP